MLVSRKRISVSHQGPYMIRTFMDMQKIVPLAIATILLFGAPAFAQVDFTGFWTATTNWEDGPERVQGPSLVEFLGLPINDQARQWGLAYRSSRLSILEHQCQVHVVSYIHRGPFQSRIWEERDPVTHQLVAIRQAITNYGQAANDLDGWTAAPFRQRGTHLDGFLDRRVGREHADDYDDPHQAGLAPALEYSVQ